MKISLLLGGCVEYKGQFDLAILSGISTLQFSYTHLEGLLETISSNCESMHFSADVAAQDDLSSRLGRDVALVQNLLQGAVAHPSAGYKDAIRLPSGASRLVFYTSNK